MGESQDVLRLIIVVVHSMYFWKVRHLKYVHWGFKLNFRLAWTFGASVTAVLS